MDQPPVLTSSKHNFDASEAVCLRSPLSTLPAGIIVPTFLQRSPPALFDDAKTLHVTAKCCGCVGWQRNSLGGSDGVQLLARLPQYRVEVTHTELNQDRFHPVDCAGPFLHQ